MSSAIAPQENTTKSDIPSTQLIATLDPIISTLNAFNHRHKNQHRVARWWSQFDLLRRSVSRLSEALHLHIKALSYGSSSSTKKKRNVKDQAIGRLKHESHILESATFLNDHVLPKSYIAFTQLAADQQHAPLGLLLIGLLARIRADVLGFLLPESSLATTEDDVKPSLHSSKTVADHASGAEMSSKTAGSAADEDMGVAISRDTVTEAPPRPKAERPVVPAEKPPKKSSASQTPPAKRAPSPDEATLASPKPPKKKKTDKSATLKKKKKKPGGGGDDFSNLFGSLL